MNVLNLQSMTNVSDKTFVSDKKSVLSINFNSMLAEELNETTNYEIPANFENYRCGANFGDGMNFSFPPDDAPDYFKSAWYEVTSKMDFEERICIFNDDVTTALRYGYYFSMDYELNSVDFEKDFNAMNSRVKSLGCVGCLELAIRSAEQGYNDNVHGGNEKIFTDKMKRSLDAMKEIMKKCQESGDLSISQQIRMADFDFEQSKKKVYRDADIWLQEHGGNDLGTMSDEKFKSIIGEDDETFMKILPDGTILTTVMRDGHIINSFRNKEHALDLSSLI